MAVEHGPYIYPDKMSWYDSNRRDRYGSYYDYNEGYAYARYDSAPPTYIQTFYLDGTDTDSDHRKTVTLTTLANDVTLELEYYIEENPSGTIENYNFYLWGTARVKDKDGHVIYDAAVGRDLETGVALSSNREWSSLDKFELMYISSDIGYYVDGEMAYVDMFGKMFGKRYWEPPYSGGFLGQNISADELSSKYDYMSLFEVLNWDDYDHFMDLIENGGDGTPVKPKKPEDDESKPSPDPPPGYDPDPQPEPIPFPPKPGGDAISTGFIHVYSPSADELRQIAGQLWSDGFVNTIKRVQNDPMEAIISLHNVPFNPKDSVANCVIGNYDTHLLIGNVTEQWHKRDLGSIYIPENWSSALDYAPYVSVDCFIPYVGVRTLQVDDIIGKIISIEMTVDVISGAAIAHVKCGGSVLYTYNTSLSGEIPVSQSSFAPMYNAIVGSMGNVLCGYGAAGAPGAAAAAVGSAVNVAMSKQHSISRSGSIGGSTGCMGIFTPYLIIHRPIQSLAGGFRHFKGYPSNITTNLGTVSGYTEIESIHLDGIKCTESERDEIRALLYNGVIF